MALHRGYSCPSLVTATTPTPMQHSISSSGATQKKQQDANPLTEANLKTHTAKTAYGRESRHRRVQTYVESQLQLLRLEAELERRRRMEIQSLVPLDTPTYEQDVIITAAENNDKRTKRWFRWFSKRQAPEEASIQRNSIATFEQYQEDKAHLVGQGLYGLSNRNIARALGAGGLASLIFSPPPSPADDSQITSTSTSHQKRDSGVSFFGALSSKSSKKSRAEPLTRSKSISAGFVTARYPKMIHLKTLRGAAIQALSSDFSLGEESVPEYCCSPDLPNCCCPR
ncbi:hypothetical protein BJV82DRAFT_710348 [Fennellomyces sp. T-0311]|nr:hypothetical protein BJV82DRAFT_710348 [Fennellomyces sp. T-0311]